MADSDAQARHICEEWHADFNEQDIDRVLALFAKDAVIETPAVLSVYPDRDEGILRGRDEIGKLSDRNLAHLKDAFQGLCRNGLLFSNGRYLTWEHPRKTLTSMQVDLFESIDVADGLIVSHRVFWGWRELTALMDVTKKASVQ